MCREKNIILKPGFVSNADMEAFLRCSDVLVLPYNMTSSMNSGAMIMAFSYGKTAIVPRIAMADDISNEKLAFVYDYETDEENCIALKENMEQAFHIGKNEIKKMEEQAKKYVEKYNNPKTVLEALAQISI